MSIKTLRKRIALVAVSALGVGLLSVAPASAAIAAGDIDFTATSTTKNVGACSITNGTAARTTYAYFTNGSDVELTMASNITDAMYLSLTGPGVFTGASSATTLTATAVTDTGTAQNATFTVRLTGTGTVTLSYATGSTAAATDEIRIFSVATCAGGTLDLASSNFTIVDVLEADSDSTEGAAWTAAYNGVDTAGEDVQPNGGTAYLRAALADEYSAVLPSKAMIATSTGGCKVGLAATTTSAPSITTATGTAVLTSTGADVIVAITQGTANAPSACTVTLSWNGITVGSKSVTIQGVPSKVSVSDITVGEKSGHGYYRVTVTDAAGNLLPSISITNSTTEANNAAAIGVVSDSSSNTTSTSATAGSGYGKTPSVTAANITAGTVGRYSCTAAGGSAKVTVRAPVGLTYVTSDPFTVLCGGSSVGTWSISLDKAQYAPGEIATLTVSAKDSAGASVGSLVALGTLEYSFGGMTAVTAPTSVDTFSSGIGTKTYQFSVGTTEGAFVGTFKITGSVDTTAKTLQYKVVAPSTGAVTNAEVLAAIVKLIASINKQIRALQKSLKR